MNIVLAIVIFSVLSALLGAALGFCSKLFHVENDPRVDEIVKMLPGANCGGCGHPGCAGMAEAIVNDKANPAGCKPCKADQIEKIKEYYRLHTGPNGEYVNENKN